MISVPIRDMNGGECGVYTFEPADVSDNICKQLLHDAVVMYRSNRRVGEVQTKSRGMVAGSTRKLFKQTKPPAPRKPRAAAPVMNDVALRGLFGGKVYSGKYKTDDERREARRAAARRYYQKKKAARG